ncbi:MAG: M12 family metallo-peptidase [Bacteroidota bacterium]|nr:M12 family metallo-peptidase [Bacteroidota bacterium]
MKPSTKILLFAISFCCFFQEIRFSKEGAVNIQKSLFAQDNTNSIWSDVTEISFTLKGERRILPLKYRTVKTDFNNLNNILGSAPFELSERARNSPFIIELPAPDGTLSKFLVTEYSMMEPGLAAQFPEIKTYNIKGIDDPYATGKIDLTISGFHAMVLTPNGDYFIDPYSSDEKEIYISYYKSDFSSKEKFECYVNEEIINDGTGNNSILTGQQLRTYRLACAATGEYTAFFGGTVTQGLSAIVTAVNRVNGVYERDASVRMTLVANNNLLIYTNPSTDPYTNNNGGAMLNQNQTTCTNVIGSANYDIGHVFSTGGGGVAGLGVVCINGSKAFGVTGLPTPVGDPFYIDYVAHEIGHQFSGNHTFNGTGCGGTNGSTAWEPGSGSTIMAYAGICGADDLQPNSDAYFHSGSVTEITNYTQFSNGSTCPVVTNTGNTPPTVTVPTSGFTIPINTPFQLTGSATDVENPGSLTYCWEEFDIGPAGSPNSPSGNAPIFRSFSPVVSPSRTFPKLSNLVTNTQTIGEILPSYTRNLNFRLTVRDNSVGGGGINFGSVSFAVNSTGGAFLVTQPNTNVNWNSGVPQTVTWNAGSTASAPFNVSLVNIKLSTNGGNTFATTLLANTPNDGSQSVTLPNISITNARIKVEAVGNIFFDISNTNFTITGTALPVITHTPLTDMLKQNWPATVNAVISSTSGLDSSWVIWYKNTTANTKEFKLINTSGNNYSAPFNSLNSDVVVGDFIYYKIFAQNNSASHEKDSTVLYSFKIIDGSLCQAFTSTTFPPSGWSIQFPVLQNYWLRSSASAYGVGNGSARFAFWNAPVDTIQSMVTHTFSNTIAGDSLNFDNAYAPFSSGTDSLRIETSTDAGASYTVLERLWGDEVSGIGGNSLNTRATLVTQYISPASTEWISRKFALPVGTNKIKFRARSGSGNNLFLDNICVSSFVAAAPSTITLAPQGFYNTSTLNLNMRDTVSVYLRNTTVPFAIADSGKTVIDSVTLSGSLTFNSAPTGTYYVVVRHRNSIETWSKSGGESYVMGTAFSYDFTSAITQAFGNNLILRSTEYCIYSGDVNQDYSIDLSDLAQIDNALSNFANGYVPEDLNGDFFVDLADYTFADNNAANFVTRIAPPGAEPPPLSKRIKTVLK